MRLFVKRVNRSTPLIREIEEEVTAFLREIDQTVAQLRAQYETEKEAA
jgi:hypothetical protein